jgi:hypothetical protein
MTSCSREDEDIAERIGGNKRFEVAGTGSVESESGGGGKQLATPICEGEDEGDGEREEGVAATFGISTVKSPNVSNDTDPLHPHSGPLILKQASKKAKHFRTLIIPFTYDRRHKKEI